MSVQQKFVPRVLIRPDGSVGILVEEDGAFVFKNTQTDDVTIGRVPSQGEIAGCKEKAEDYLDSLFGLSYRIKSRHKLLLALANACSNPVVVGRPVQVGDVVEGHDKTFEAGLLQSIERELCYTDDFDCLMGSVVTSYGCIDVRRLDTLCHASEETLVAVGARARTQEAEARATITARRAEYDFWTRAVAAIE
jgi:hypothetical protein